MLHALGWGVMQQTCCTRTARQTVRSHRSHRQGTTLTAAFSRIEASKSAATLRVSDAFKNEDGAFDLPSILVGVVVVGVLTAGVLASIFGVIPFAQDKGAQQDLGAVVTAEGTYKAQVAPIAYGNLADLQTGAAGALLGSGVKVGVVKSADSAHFTAASKSGSGHIFIVSDTNTTPQDVTDALPVAGTDGDLAIAAIPTS
jgi:type II secretory pathway pseudopilin PulG